MKHPHHPSGRNAGSRASGIIQSARRRIHDLLDEGKDKLD